MSTLPLSGRRTAPARQLFAVLTAAFLLFQQAIIFAPAAHAQTRRAPTLGKSIGTKAPAKTPVSTLDDTVNPNISVTTLGSPITQNFDTLIASGSTTWTNDSTLTGWYHARTGTGTTIVANDGSSNAGNLYSYGTGTATDRALGSLGSGNAAVGNLFWGIRLTNNTGATITSLDVSYVGEQWRNSAAAAQTVAFSYLVGSPTVTGSLAEFQSAGVAVAALDFTSPITGGSAGALNGNLAANRVAISSTITGLNIPNGTDIMLRWADPDHTGADHGLSIDDFSVTANGTATPTPTPTPSGATVSISDAVQVEGTGGGTTTFAFLITVSTPSHGGVTLTFSTADGTAQDGNPGGEDNDYQALTTPVVFPNGSDSITIPISVNADSVVEPDETFFGNLSNVSGATVADGQAQATIQNDDFTLTPIHDIQGNGAASPIAGQTVTTTGIVTLLKTGSNTGAVSTANGFFMQDPVVDADPNTSEGIFVFTSSVPTVAVGDSVRVSATVAEFNGLTELSTVTNTTVLSSGNSLPTAVTLDSIILDPTAAATQPQLEKYESMRLTGTLKTVSPNDTFYDVYTVLSAVARPLREPGIPSGNTVPPDPTSGVPDPNIPIWDRNPERLKVDTNGRAGAANAPYTSNVTFTGISGPLDYAFGDYRLVADNTPSASANMTAVAVPVPDSNEFTVAGYNIENFNNNATQRQKAADTIRNLLHSPDILGAVEIFDLADLQALRDQINNDAVANSQPNPAYEAYLVEQDGTSEDSDQDVGFLVKTSRVAVNSVTQEREEVTYINPNTGNPETLHDRPPLVLDATVDPSGTDPQHVIVIVNHLRSFIDIELVAGEGPRVRAKRKAQAEDLADLLNDLQTANPGVPVISVGDYNAFEFNTGYDDPISVLKGNPTADDQIVVDQSPDLVDPNFFNLIDTLPAAERYSFFFSDDGAMQALDHHLVNAAARARNSRIAIARVNSDFPEAPAATYASNAATPERNSDHDPVVSYYRLGAAQAAGSLVISEFRFRGPGNESEVSPASVKGAGRPPAELAIEQDTDEFVELYNNTDDDITVATLDGSVGWAVVAADGATRFIIPNDTIIPARGHFLAANVGYSLDSYGTPDEIILPSDLNPSPTPTRYTQQIPDGSGLALFSTAEPANFTLANRIDAAGYATVPALYREGTGFPAAGAEATSDLEYSFVRKVCVFGGVGCGGPGLPKDSSDNTADFVVVNTAAAATTLGAKLGAPGPEGLTSPINGNAGMPASLLDSSVSASQPPNRVRDFGMVTNGTFGTLSIRRTVTNNTGSPVRYLAFRIIDITTNPVPSGTADLRAIDSGDIVVTVGGNPVDVRGTNVEQPPLQLNGGGLNSSLAVGFIDLENQLEDGESVNVQFLLGIQQTGAFKFYVNVELLNDGLVPEGPVSMGALNLKKLRQEQQQRRRPRRATK